MDPIETAMEHILEEDRLRSKAYVSGTVDEKWCHGENLKYWIAYRDGAKAMKEYMEANK